jgi:hypothetical protein
LLRRPQCHCTEVHQLEAMSASVVYDGLCVVGDPKFYFVVVPSSMRVIQVAGLLVLITSRRNLEFYDNLVISRKVKAIRVRAGS